MNVFCAFCGALEIIAGRPFDVATAPSEVFPGTNEYHIFLYSKKDGLAIQELPNSTRAFTVYEKTHNKQCENKNVKFFERARRRVVLERPI